jgi:hypothetical protein
LAVLSRYADDYGLFAGWDRRHHRVSVDGLDNNDEFTGSSRTELSPEEVQEYQVVNNGLSAEYGGASGGSINVLTRPGANVVFNIGPGKTRHLKHGIDLQFV